MKKRTKWVGVIIIVLLVAIQFWPIDRTNPPVRSDIQAPPEVKQVFRSACYDCHSNESRWPWYGYVAPVSWLLASDISEARGHLNFSEWGTIPAGDRPATAKHIWKEVSDGDMPLLMYRIMHSDARLSEAQKNVIRDWALQQAGNP